MPTVPDARRVLDDVLHRLQHELLVGLKFPSPLAMQISLDGQLPASCLCRFEGAQHGVHEGVRRFAVQGVEPIVEAAECNRVQREPRHVGWHIHRVVGV